MPNPSNVARQYEAMYYRPTSSEEKRYIEGVVRQAKSFASDVLREAGNFIERSYEKLRQKNLMVLLEFHLVPLGDVFLLRDGKSTVVLRPSKYRDVIIERMVVPTDSAFPHFYREVEVAMINLLKKKSPMIIRPLENKSLNGQQSSSSSPKWNNKVIDIKMRAKWDTYTVGKIKAFLVQPNSKKIWQFWQRKRVWMEWGYPTMLKKEFKDYLDHVRSSSIGLDNSGLKQLAMNRWQPWLELGKHFPYAYYGAYHGNARLSQKQLIERIRTTEHIVREQRKAHADAMLELSHAPPKQHHFSFPGGTSYHIGKATFKNLIKN
jgi:hypothetical protein